MAYDSYITYNRSAAVYNFEAPTLLILAAALLAAIVIWCIIDNIKENTPVKNIRSAEIIDRKLRTKDVYEEAGYSSGGWFDPQWSKRHYRKRNGY